MAQFSLTVPSLPLLSIPGACGLIFISEALQAGHNLTLYARSPSKFSKDVSENENVRIVKGGLDDIDSLKEALARRPEAIVSFLGPDVPSKGMVCDCITCNEVSS